MLDILDTRRGTEEIQIQDLQSPWTFYLLFLSDERTVNSWCQAIGLLATSVKCSSKVKIRQNGDGLTIIRIAQRKSSLKNSLVRLTWPGSGEIKKNVTTRRA